MKKVYFQPNVEMDACIKGTLSFMSVTVPHNPETPPMPAPERRKAF